MVPHREQYTSLRNEFGSACGSLVNALSVLPVSTDGRLDDAWEKTILYSNLRARRNAGSGAGGNVGETQAPTCEHAGDGGSSIGGSPSGLDAASRAVKTAKRLRWMAGRVAADVIAMRAKPNNGTLGNLRELLGPNGESCFAYCHGKALVAFSEVLAQKNPDEPRKQLMRPAEIFRKIGAKRDLEKAEAKLELSMPMRIRASRKQSEMRHLLARLGLLRGVAQFLGIWISSSAQLACWLLA